MVSGSPSERDARAEAEAVRVKWKQRAYRTPCEHLVLELEWNEQGYLTGNYVCNLCGVSVARYLWPIVA